MIEINNKTRSRINLLLIKKIVEKFFKTYSPDAAFDVSIAFVGDITMRRLNRVYRGKNKITDVLVFLLSSPRKNRPNSKYLGEIIIDYAQIKRQSKTYKNTIQRELIFILVHGLLHLLGYNDNTERGRRKMEELGEGFISKLKV
jgi:probable rRNA maturation factor